MSCAQPDGYYVTDNQINWFDYKTYSKNTLPFNKWRETVNSYEDLHPQRWSPGFGTAMNTLLPKPSVKDIIKHLDMTDAPWQVTNVRYGDPQHGWHGIYIDFVLKPKTKKCDCAMQILMAHGCQCGGE